MFHDTRYIPFTLSCISLTFQIIHALFYWTTTKHHTKPLLNHPETIPPSQANRNSPQSLPNLEHYIKYHGGSTIFGFLLARLIGCLVLLSLSVLGGCKPPSMDDISRGVFWNLLSLECPESFMVLTYVSPSLESSSWTQVLINWIRTKTLRSTLHSSH